MLAVFHKKFSYAKVSPAQLGDECLYYSLNASGIQENGIRCRKKANSLEETGEKFPQISTKPDRKK